VAEITTDAVLDTTKLRAPAFVGGPGQETAAPRTIPTHTNTDHSLHWARTLDRGGTQREAVFDDQGPL